MKFPKKYMLKELYCPICNEDFKKYHFCLKFTITYDNKEIHVFTRQHPLDDFAFKAKSNEAQTKLNNFIKNLIFI